MKFGTILSGIVAALTMFAALPASAQSRVEAGDLRCRSPGSVGFVVGSVTDFRCVYSPAGGGRPQRYLGRMSHVGVDLGVSQNVEMGWAVYAPTHYLGRGDLSGNYGGLQAGATVGVGLGANALIGGSENSFALQPIVGQAQLGLGVNAGLAGLELRPAGYGGPRHHWHHRRHH